MQFTTAQKATVKADILANSDLNSQPNNSDGAFAIAALYNLPAAVSHWVHKSSVSRGEVVNQASVDGTTFNWAGNGFITRSVGEQTAWSEIWNHEGMIDPSKANIRQAFLDIFSGTGNAAANRTHLAAISRRLASRLEKLLATGTGSSAAPATMGFEGPVSYQDVQEARNS